MNIKCKHCAHVARDKRAMVTHYKSSHRSYVQSVSHSDSFFENFLMTQMIFDMTYSEPARFDEPSRSFESPEPSRSYEAPEPSQSYEAPSTYEAPSSGDFGGGSFD